MKLEHFFSLNLFHIAAHFEYDLSPYNCVFGPHSWVGRLSAVVPVISLLYGTKFLKNSLFPGLWQGMYKISLTSQWTWNYGSTQKLMGTWKKKKVGRSQIFKCSLLAESGIIWASKYIMIVVDYNQFNKLEIHQLILIHINEEL